MSDLLNMTRKLDQQDELGHFREKFFIPPHHDGSELHYFVGHSLGLQPKSGRWRTCSAPAPKRSW